MEEVWRRCVLTLISQIYAKAFDQDERLLAVGFLDVGVHTTCIRALKNLVLVGDAVNGLHFIAFQVSGGVLYDAHEQLSYYKHPAPKKIRCRRSPINL